MSKPINCPYCDLVMNAHELEDGCCSDCLYGMSEDQYEQHERERIEKLYPFLKHTKRMSVADLHDAERSQKAVAA